MRRRVPQRLTTAVALYALLLGVLPQVVLCVGSDGHVALEGLSTLCCTGLGGAESATAGRMPDCPPDCTDSRLGFSAATSSSDRSSTPSGAGHVATVALPSWQGTVAMLSGVSSARQALAAAPPPRLLRTTVILC